MLPPRDVSHADRFIEHLEVTNRAIAGTAFWSYVRALQRALRARLRNSHVDVVHCQHLAFGASPALIGALPNHRRIGLCHGTDLLIADRNNTQRKTLRHIVDACHRIVVPTVAMADHLRRVVPGLPADRLVHLPWGVPDELLNGGLAKRSARDGGPLKMLYAGRLTDEKGFASLLGAVREVPDVHLAVASPEDEFASVQAAISPRRFAVTYLGWLDRAALWNLFPRYDCLAVPSVFLEAFGLVAVEAQAAGLPVLYQPVPGLSEVLGDSALPIDMTDSRAFAAEIAHLIADPNALNDLRAAGLRNARRFPLSRTSTELARLSEQTA